MQQGSITSSPCRGWQEYYNSDTLVFDVTRVRSDAVHVNQIGFLPDAGRKFGYISGHGWVIKAPSTCDAYEGTRFHLIDLASGPTGYLKDNSQTS